MDLTRLTELKYQTNPDLIIQECLEADDPTEEIKHSMMALATFGLSSTAVRLERLLPKYGIELDWIVMETYIYD